MGMGKTSLRAWTTGTFCQTRWKCRLWCCYVDMTRRADAFIVFFFSFPRSQPPPEPSNRSHFTLSLWLLVLVLPEASPSSGVSWQRLSWSSRCWLGPRFGTFLGRTYCENVKIVEKGWWIGWVCFFLNFFLNSLSFSTEWSVPRCVCSGVWRQLGPLATVGFAMLVCVSDYTYSYLFLLFCFPPPWVVTLKAELSMTFFQKKVMAAQFDLK